jgi:uncharacterized protein (DUF1810 family)
LTGCGERSALQILDKADAMKCHACQTLFAQAPPQE